MLQPTTRGPPQHIYPPDTRVKMLLDVHQGVQSSSPAQPRVCSWTPSSMTGVRAFGNARVGPLRAHVLVQDGAAIMSVGRAAKSIWLRICKFTSVSDQFHQNSSGVKILHVCKGAWRCRPITELLRDVIGVRGPASTRIFTRPRSEVNHLRPFLIGQS